MVWAVAHTGWTVRPVAPCPQTCIACDCAECCEQCNPVVLVYANTSEPRKAPVSVWYERCRVHTALLCLEVSGAVEGDTVGRRGERHQEEVGRGKEGRGAERKLELSSGKGRQGEGQSERQHDRGLARGTGREGRWARAVPRVSCVGWWLRAPPLRLPHPLGWAGGLRAGGQRTEPPSAQPPEPAGSLAGSQDKHFAYSPLSSLRTSAVSVCGHTLSAMLQRLHVCWIYIELLFCGEFSQWCHGCLLLDSSVPC